MYSENEASIAIEKLLNYFQVSTISALADKLGISQPSISAWKKNNYISAIQKKCRELGIYGEIFENPKINRLKNSKKEVVSEKELDINENQEGLLEEDESAPQIDAYLKILKNVAKLENREDDLERDIKNLIQKYMGAKESLDDEKKDNTNKNEVDCRIDKLFDHFGVSGLQELAPCMGVTAGALSNWRRRESIAPIKKRCRELGIYNKIFE